MDCPAPPAPYHSCGCSRSPSSGSSGARRGDPQQWPPLDQAVALSEGQHELQYRAPVIAARAEAAWLNSRGPSVDDITRDVLDTAVDRRACWVVGELAWLRRLAGIHETVPAVIEPYSAQLAGDASAAAARWTQLGCPYDAALALIETDDEHSLRRALAEFQRLGARPAAGIVARRLREHGVRDLPRGPRAETEDPPARPDPSRSRGARTSNRACQTPRSPPGCTCQRRPFNITSRRSSASSVSPAADRGIRASG